MMEQLRTLADLGCVVPEEPHRVAHSRFEPEDVRTALKEIKRQMENIGKPLVENGVVCGIVFVLVPQRITSVYGKQNTICTRWLLLHEHMLLLVAF